ncbi:hypothetical protein Tco_0063922 [Tanacetum coccineum]
MSRRLLSSDTTFYDNGDVSLLDIVPKEIGKYRMFTKGQKTKPNRTKPRAELKRARKTEAKGAKGLKTELKRTFPDRLDNVCAFNEVKTKSKSTPGYGVGKGIENRTRKPKLLKVGPPVPT